MENIALYAIYFHIGHIYKESFTQFKLKIRVIYRKI